MFGSENKNPSSQYNLNYNSGSNGANPIGYMAPSWSDGANYQFGSNSQYSVNPSGQNYQTPYQNTAPGTNAATGNSINGPYSAGYSVGSGMSNTPATLTPQTWGEKMNGFFADNSSTLQGISNIASAGVGLANIYTGIKGLSAAERDARFQRNAWNMNYNNSIKDYNTRMSDRYSSRMASMGKVGDYNSLEDYMKDKGLEETDMGKRKKGNGSKKKNRNQRSA